MNKIELAIKQYGNVLIVKRILGDKEDFSKLAGISKSTLDGNTVEYAMSHCVSYEYVALNFTTKDIATVIKNNIIENVRLINTPEKDITDDGFEVIK